VRIASAHWLRAAAAEGKIDQAVAERALARCASRDPETTVRRACEASRSRKAAQQAPDEPLVIEALLREGEATLADRLVGVRFANGLMRVGYTDRNGMLHLPLSPAGPVALEDPSTLPLEPVP
jgi:hypothetical protein